MIITTERLILRRWNESDIEPYSALCNDSEVMRWIGNGSTKTRLQCIHSVELFEKEWNENGLGLFAAEHHKSGELIGFIGLSRPQFLPEVMPAVEIGWRLARRYWGQGLATEGAKAAMEFGFEQINLKRIISIYQHGNDSSVRIMKKLGMTFERETIDPGCNRAVSVYERIKSELEW